MSLLDWDRTESRVALHETLLDMQARSGATLLDELVASEIPWIGIADDDGGPGGDLGDAALAARTLAQLAVDAPIAETGLVCGWALGVAALRAPQQLMAPAFDATIRLTGSIDAGALRVTGVVAEVPAVASADLLVAPVDVDGMPHLCVIPLAESRITPGVNLAGESRGSVELDRALATAFGPLPHDTGAIDLRARLALARAIQSAGALAAVRDLSVGYARTREQFGRPLSDLQVIAQMLAELAELSLMAEAAVAAAIERPGTWQSAIAASVTGRSARRATKIAHQVHGAMGMSQEYPLGALTTRLWSWTEEGGRPEAWEAWLGTAFLEQPAPLLWETVVHGRQGRPA